MRHKRYKRREGRLTSKDIKDCEFFAIEGRRIKAQKVEFKFWRDYNVAASAVLYDDAPHKQTVIRWYIIATILFNMEPKRRSRSI